MILDRSQRTERYSSADFFVHAGIPTAIDAAHVIAHNKVIVIDARQVIPGSFNFTKTAEERNTENLLMLTDPVLASRYLEPWQVHGLFIRTSEYSHGAYAEASASGNDQSRSPMGAICSGGASSTTSA